METQGVAAESDALGRRGIVRNAAFLGERKTPQPTTIRPCIVLPNRSRDLRRVDCRNRPIGSVDPIGLPTLVVWGFSDEQVLSDARVLYQIFILAPCAVIAIGVLAQQMLTARDALAQ
jgi:hypothetical protein